MEYNTIVLLIVLCLVQWRLAQAQSINCESAGVCQETEEKCRPDSETECLISGILNQEISKYPSYEVPGEEDDEVDSSRRSECTLSSDKRSDIDLQDIALDYISTSPIYVSLCVSWSLAESSGYYGGYEVRFNSNRNRIRYRYCVKNSNRTRVCINNFRYDDLHHYHTVDVLPYPRLPQDDDDKFKKSLSLRRDIEGCADVKHNGTRCNVKRYPKPENLTFVMSMCEDGTKRMNISWDHPLLQLDVPLPEVYHVYLDNKTGTHSHYFSVRNANQVVLSNLSAAHNYSVQVQAYRMCAGLGAYSPGVTFGCGRLIEERKELIGTCDPISTSRPMLNGTHHYNITVGGNEGGREDHEARNPYLIPVLSVLSVTNIALLVALTLIIILLGTKVCQRFSGTTHSCIYPKKTVYKVFVFYSPKMTQSHLDYFQKHVICNLLNYFEVVTLSDISKGNVSMWLEDTVNTADSVLLVGNKELYSDWESKERSPVLNSLELLISAAASLNTIAKFGFISTEDSTKDVCIPENSYLKLMPVFLMGKKKCEVEKLYQFVTKTRGIEFSKESQWEPASDSDFV